MTDLEKFIREDKFKTFKYKLKEKITYRYKLLRGYIGKDYEPLKCHKCKSTELYEEIIDTIESNVCEKDIICKKCNTVVGFWGYGYYQP